MNTVGFNHEQTICSSTTGDFIFDGFEPSNTTPVPDVLFDVLLTRLNEAQLKVMLYIIRRTLGFKKTADAISLMQFRYGITCKDGKKLDEGCGLKNFTSITKALRFLEDMCCIESVKTQTASKDAATTVYRVHFKGTTANVVPPTPNVVGVLRQTYDRTTPNVVGVLRQTEPQETVIQETVIQETVIQEKNIHIALVSDDASERVSHVSSEIENARNLGGVGLHVALQHTDTAVPIASTRRIKKKTPDVKQTEMDVPPSMPLPDAAWNKRTAVQIVEARKGRRYSDKTRESEERSADKVLTTIQIHGHFVTREEFEQAWSAMRAWNVWEEKSIEPMIRHLLKDDRVVSLVKPANVRQLPGASSRQPSSVQQQLQEKAPEFVFLPTDKLMELPLAERKAYNAAMRAAIRANEEKQAVNA